jgi:endonuclease/exonuclease/phosphatase family metal-dependent hydrolase
VRTEQSHTMRLLSYNIHKGIGGGDRRYQLGRIIEVIREERPDLVCLQEVDRNVSRSRYHDQPLMLAHELEVATHLYQLNVQVEEGGYGNLLLSRWPIRQHHHVSLRLDWRKPRGAQLAVVETPEGPLHLVNWHLGLAEGERRWQVHHLLHHPLFAESGHLPTLIAGDFNDWRNTLAHHAFGPHHFRQATSPYFKFRSFPAFLALASLDRAFYRGDLEVHDAHVVRSRLARQASDHLPIVLDFRLQPGAGHGHHAQHGHHACPTCAASHGHGHNGHHRT